MERVVSFWFEELTPRDWFSTSDELDVLIRQRFESLHGQILAGETWEWRDHARGRLAEILVLDQFGRYPHRNHILGRQSTDEETQWMNENSGF